MKTKLSLALVMAVGFWKKNKTCHLYFTHAMNTSFSHIIIVTCKMHCTLSITAEPKENGIALEETTLVSVTRELVKKLAAISPVVLVDEYDYPIPCQGEGSWPHLPLTLVSNLTANRYSWPY